MIHVPNFFLAYSMQSLIKLLSQKITCINFILGEGGLKKNILGVKNKKMLGWV